MTSIASPSGRWRASAHSTGNVLMNATRPRRMGRVTRSRCGDPPVEAPDHVVVRVALHGDAPRLARSRARARRPSPRSASTAPAAWAIVSSTTVPWMSFAPKCSATWASGVEIMIQYALMFGMLSSIRRETACILRSSCPVVNDQPRRSKTVFSGWNGSGMKARKPPVSSCSVAQAQQVVDALLVVLDVVVEHRAVRRHAHAVGQAVHVEPDLGRLLARRDELADAMRRRPRRRRRAASRAPRRAARAAPRAWSRPESFVMWWISDAVKHLRCTSGSASCSARIEVDVVVEVRCGFSPPTMWISLNSCVSYTSSACCTRSAMS